MLACRGSRPFRRGMATARYGSQAVSAVHLPARCVQAGGRQTAQRTVQKTIGDRLERYASPRRATPYSVY